MKDASVSNIPNLAVMVRPAAFGFNAQTAVSNSFQQNISLENIQKKAQHEFDAMIDKMKNHGIAVQVFEDLKVDLPDSVFCNNWMIHLPEKMLAIFPMCTPNRRAEVRMDITDWIMELTETEEFFDLRTELEKNNFLEGTGSVVFDYRNKIAFAAESPRTNVELFEKFCAEIAYKPVSFQSTDLKGDLIYHTNVMLTVADKFALVCLESIPDLLERNMLIQHLELSGHEIILLSFSQMNQFAGNCIELLNEHQKPFLLMSSTAFNALTSDQKKQISKYDEILHFDIPVIEKIGGGSVRCMITGIFNYPR